MKVTNTVSGSSAEPSRSVESADFGKAWARARVKNTNEALSKLSDSSECTEVRRSTLQEAIPRVPESSTRFVNGVKAKYINSPVLKYDEFGLIGGAGSRNKENSSAYDQMQRSALSTKLRSLERELADSQSYKRAGEIVVDADERRLRNLTVGSEEHTELSNSISDARQILTRIDTDIAQCERDIRMTERELASYD